MMSNRWDDGADKATTRGALLAGLRDRYRIGPGLEGLTGGVVRERGPT